MTVSYGDECATVSNFGNFWRLLFRWKASIYKLLWMELLIFLFLYYSLNIFYNHLFAGALRTAFQHLCYYCKSQMTMIPLSFVLGFYVSNIISRWGTLFTTFPIPDSIAIVVSASIPGKDETSRLMRRTIVRYVNLSTIILMMGICTPVKKRFPSFGHLVAAGIMFETELQALEYINNKISNYGIYWVPLAWASNVVVRARRQKRITSDIYVDSIIQNICRFRERCAKLLVYDWITIPLVYTQVVTLAVHTFFLAALFGRQVMETDNPQHPIDVYFPIFTILQFLFYMGWLKVAETLLNPFGEDDDDFNINKLIDRNMQLTYAIVDEVHQKLPDLLKDQFWDQVIPDILPHTPESQKIGTHISVHDMPVSLRRFSTVSRNLSVGERTEIRLKAKMASSASNKSPRVTYVFAQYPRVEALFTRLFYTPKNTHHQSDIELADKKHQRRIRITDSTTDSTMFNTMLNRRIDANAAAEHPTILIESGSLLEEQEIKPFTDYQEKYGI